MSILVIGSVNIDVVTYARRLPRPGESFKGDRYAMVLGGKGANQAVAAARLGARVDLVGRVGGDPFGALAERRLSELGVATRYLQVDPQHPTGLAAINVIASGENFITVIAGANQAVDPDCVAGIAPLLDATKVLLMQLEVPLDASLIAARRARAAGALVVLDPAPIPDCPLPDAVFGLVDVMTPNELETEALVGIRPATAAQAAQAARALTDRGIAIAIVKMGANGVYFRGPDVEGYWPRFPVTAIDTVAAGDCFNGGLAVAMARGDGLAQAVRFAAACGALATTRRGASDAAPVLAEVEALLASS
ncbi:MAG: ribokinase [Azospirillaceae bacterium]|nr:ribokinase [Azospirillaceae bacterium]